MELPEYERPLLCIVVNQWRDAIVQFGDPRTTPGGRGKNYTYLTRVAMAQHGHLLAMPDQSGQLVSHPLGRDDYASLAPR